METDGIDYAGRGGIAAKVAGTALGVVRTGIHLGIGLTALAVESAHRLGAEAVRRGAVIEHDGREKLVAFEREKVAEMKDYLKRGRGKQDDVSVEAKVEQALATFDVPTRDDIRELHVHIASLGDKINRLQST
jgi:polyhydroxyalkanoate synthesis regulator phasin